MDFTGKVINGIYAWHLDRSPYENFYDRLAILLSDVSLWINVNVDTDELLVELGQTTQFEERFVKPLWAERFLGKKLIGYWEAKNQSGYFDLIALGIEEYIPTVILTSISSQIQVRFYS